MPSVRETLDSITDFGELREFCADIDCRECEMVLTKEEMDNKIMYEVQLRSDSWEELRDFLNTIEVTEGDSGYYLESYISYEYTGLDNEDIDGFKEGIEEFIAQKEYEERRSADIDDEEDTESGMALEDMLKGE